MINNNLKTKAMDYRTFTEDEFPYQILEQFGLPQTMVEDLPMSVLEDLSAGHLSPMVPISVSGEDGTVVKSKARFKFIRMDDGRVDVLFHPQLLHSEIEQYSEIQERTLLDGGAIVALAPDGSGSKCFVQVDKATNQLLYVPTPVIARNLSTLMDRFHLTSEQIQTIQDGQIVSFPLDEETISMGIDLQEKTGIKIVVGNKIKWEETLGEGLDRYNFGLFGCWTLQEDGSLEYIHEEDYTEGIWAEQQKIIEQNRVMKR